MKVRRRDASGENFVHTQAKPYHPSPLFLLYLPLLLLLLVAPSPTSAQDTVKPVPVYQSHFTSLNDKTLYIRGGRPDGSVQEPIRQFFALDLTPLLSNSIKLSWKQLNPVGPNTDFKEQMPMSVSSDNQEVTYFGADGNMSVWNKASNSWSNAPPICPSPATVTPTMFSTRSGNQSAVKDPATGRVYIPHGASNGTQMLTYLERSCSGENMPANATGKYSAWSEAKGALYVLGTMAGATETSMWMFSPLSRAWSSIVSCLLFVSLFDGVGWNTRSDTNKHPICYVCYHAAYARRTNALVQRQLHGFLYDFFASAKKNTVIRYFSRSYLTSRFLTPSPSLVGDKLIVFGGTSNKAYMNSDIFILDTNTNLWSKGAKPSRIRQGMACATGGDYFVVWSGNNNGNVFLSVSLVSSFFPG